MDMLRPSHKAVSCGATERTHSPSLSTRDPVQKLQDSLGYYFENQALLSYALGEKRQPKGIDYCHANLAFLGDAILDVVHATINVSEPRGMLFHGRKRDFTRQVSNPQYKRYALALELPQIECTVRGVKRIRKDTHTIGNLFEMVWAAVALDSSLDTCAERFLHFAREFQSHRWPTHLTTERHIIAEHFNPREDLVAKAENIFGGANPKLFASAFIASPGLQHLGQKLQKLLIAERAIRDSKADAALTRGEREKTLSSPLFLYAASKRLEIPQLSRPFYSEPLREARSIDVFRSLTAALYLQFGWEATERFFNLSVNVVERTKTQEAESLRHAS